MPVRRSLPARVSSDEEAFRLSTWFCRIGVSSTTEDVRNHRVRSLGRYLLTRSGGKSQASGDHVVTSASAEAPP